MYLKIAHEKHHYFSRKIVNNSKCAAFTHPPALCTYLYRPKNARTLASLTSYGACALSPRCHPSCKYWRLTSMFLLLNFVSDGYRGVLKMPNRSKGLCRNSDWQEASQ